MLLIRECCARDYLACANTPVELSIGLEVHVQFSSNYKLFSGRSEVSATLDVGLPGSLPVVNFGDVLGLNVLASLLSSRVSPWLSFTRKGYFCADLAAGYQITQYHNPLLGYGSLEVFAFWISGAYRVMRAHIQNVNLEHDTGSINSVNDREVVSFARAGLGLFEFVSFPCFNSVLFAKLYLLKLKLVLICLNISSCVMANAELRYDFNVSFSEPLSNCSAKVEIKNLNSLSGLSHIVLSEACSARRASRACTKAIEPKTLATLFLRKKESASEYKRLLEADLPLARLLAKVPKTQQRVLAARARLCWMFSCGRLSFFCFQNSERFRCQAYAFSQFGFSFLSLMLKHALVV
ncbi:MAG: putative aspartyl/glutamyl-tRNA(Asn/Gln) amidotransferase subunit B [Candidatus Hodgkinia cicadicola]|nr:MAG: putative aspartyl/glutamyl-tRNA(Asn/Gln) amidotransferase subunit B [Candidatus Hodgkinia cicadicola]